MHKTNILLLFLCLLIGSIFLPSCVSKKKFLNEVSRRAACDTTLQQINSRNLALNREIAELKLQLAEKTGEANGLLQIYDKQDVHIDRLEKEIDKLTDQSLSQQSLMDGSLERKKQELAEKKAMLQSFKDELSLQEQKIGQVLAAVTAALPQLGGQDLSVEVKDGLGYIRLSEKILFKPNASQLNSKATSTLKTIGNVLVTHPDLDVFIVGHTDSQTSNWDLSTLRSATIVRTFIKEVGMNPSQLTASGKGDSRPAASNETNEGREQNRRTEIVISPQASRVLRMVKEAKN